MAQVLQNRMILGALAQKREEMSDGRVTMVDLRRKLRMDPIWIEIHWRQLRWIGHIAGLPDERIEKQMLFAWMDDTKPKTKKISPTLRQQYWKRIEEMYAANGRDKKYAASTMDGGRTRGTRREMEIHDDHLEEKSTGQGEGRFVGGETPPDG